MLLFEFFEEQVRYFAVSKSLVRIAWIGNKNRKRGIFSVHVLFVQTSTQYYNTNIQNWIKIATLLYVFVFLNSLRVIWMFTFCLDNLDNLCKLCNSTLHYSPHASAWSLSTHHPIISTSWSWKPTYRSNHLFFHGHSNFIQRIKKNPQNIIWGVFISSLFIIRPCQIIRGISIQGKCTHYEIQRKDRNQICGVNRSSDMNENQNAAMQHVFDSSI